MIPFILLSLVSLVAILFCPESPTYLHARRRFEQARSAFRKISRVNKGISEWDSVRFTYEERIRKSHGDVDAGPEDSLMSVLKDKTRVKNLLLLTVCWSFTSFFFYLLSFNVKYVNGDPFYHGYILSFADIAANIAVRVA